MNSTGNFLSENVDTTPARKMYVTDHVLKNKGEK